MAVSGTTGFLVGLAASVVAMVLLTKAWQRAPRLGPVKTRARIEPALPGPVGQLASVTASGGVAAFRDVIENETRAQLAAWSRGQRTPPALPPILAALAKPGAEDAWARAEALAGYRGPSFLFPLWLPFARLTQSREAQTIRYLDALTRALQETVKP